MMHPSLLKKILRPVCAAVTMLAAIPAAHSLSIEQNPLFLITGGKPNILIILDNSNSMDEAPNGEAVGSNSSASKSEIARDVIRNLVDSNIGKVNMGLMAYKQNSPVDRYIHNSPYDVSYDPAHYDPTWTGDRANATHKRFRSPNPTSAGNYVYYNVALPFYSSANEGNGFCYSPTANAFNNGETYPGGPWDTYRCFGTKTGSTNGVVDPLPSGGIAGSETTLGYSDLYGNYTFSPTDSDLAQGILDFGKQNTWSYVGRAWLSNDSPGRGYLHNKITDLDAAQATAIKDKLKCNIPGTPSPCDSTGIKNAGLTPLEGTLLTARDYFHGGWNNSGEGYVAGCYPLPESCKHDYVILVTDGMPSTNADGSTSGTASDKLTKVANAAAALKSEGVDTYVVGFALPYGVDPTTLDVVAAAGGTETAFNASDSATLTSALNAIFANIDSKVSSGSAIAANSTQLNTETLVYQARFNSANWSGEIIAYPLDNAGALGTAKWSTNDSGSIPSPSTRNIYTSNANMVSGVISKGGIAFTGTNFSSLHTDMQNALNRDYSGTTDSKGTDRLNWLRGSSVSGMRSRSKVLGDIINSDPVFVGTESFGYSVLPAADGGGSTYITFLERKKQRRKVLYVGANDGMLHALDADTGQEIFAYLPRLLTYASPPSTTLSYKLSRLTEPTYGQPTGPAHQALVDGTFGVGDAYIDTGDGTGTRWHTILVGTFGAGGRGVFALDITEMPSTGTPNPSTIYFNTNSVLWEFSHAQLGNVMGAPQIVRLQSGAWAAVFGNGYNSDGKTSQLFAVNLATGSLISSFPINTGVGSTTEENGMGPVSGYDTGSRIFGDDTDSGSGYVGDSFYAGDLLGNVWRFTKSGGAWDSAYKSGGTKKALFQATRSGYKQPITAPIEIGSRPAGTTSGVMLFFGTGRYFVSGDNATTPVESLYGVWDDKPSSAPYGRTDLQQQTITYQGTDYRIVSQNAVTYSGGGAKKGWYLDLIPPGGSAQGERSVTTPLLRHGRVIFTTIIPSTDVCSAGGSSWLMEINQSTGGRLDYSVFDLNNDNLFTGSDMRSDGSVDRYVSGKKGNVGITKAPAWLSAGERAYKIQSGTDTSGATGGVQVTKNKGGATRPRTGWRQLFPEDK